jgi:uncharacterized membrane protein
MGKLEFLDALKRAMTGLPPEAQAKTLAFYEQRFVDGVAIGQTEEAIAADLGDPKRIAMTLRASTHMQAFETKKNPANLVRMVVAALGLAIFNLFMVVPAMVYAALLAALYASGLAFYLAGTVVTASGLSGSNEIRLDGPLRNMFSSSDYDNDGMQTKVNISENGIRVFTEPTADGKPASTSVNITDSATKAAQRASRAAALATKAAEEAAKNAAAAGDDAQAAAHEAEAAADEALAAAHDEAPGDDDERDKQSVRVAKRVESVASNGILFSTDTDDGSRTTQTFFGLGMVLGGIVLLLISLVVTRYTFIGLKRYIEMNFSLLKGN